MYCISSCCDTGMLSKKDRNLFMLYFSKASIALSFYLHCLIFHLISIYATNSKSMNLFHDKYQTVEYWIQIYLVCIPQFIKWVEIPVIEMLEIDLELVNYSLLHIPKKYLALMTVMCSTLVLNTHLKTCYKRATNYVFDHVESYYLWDNNLCIDKIYN